MQFTVEYRAKPPCQKIDLVVGEFADPTAAMAFAVESAKNHPDLTWVHSVRLHDDSAPGLQWERDVDA